MGDAPLHDAPLARSQWWGCKEPERPYDGGECWDFRCEKCRLKVQLVLRQIGDMTIFDPVGHGHQGTLSGQLERYTPADA